MSAWDTRPLGWIDLTVKTSRRRQDVIWKNRKGETRVYVSLRLCAFVNQTLWLMEPDLDRPETQGMILLKMQRQLRRMVNKLKGYEK